MSGRLPQEQGFELIRRLASDDGFRDRFESDPATAMSELGISADVIASLESKCRLARTLAPKEAFTSLLNDVNDEAILALMRMQTPQARMADGRRQEGWSSIEALSFPASVRA